MKLRYKSKKHETGDIWSFYFEPVEPISWLAGQSIRLELPRQTWGVAERRFTIASAPQEKHIQIATRLSGSEFKQLLDTLKPGQEIQGHNVEGEFTWSGVAGPTLFIAGGIGITPYRPLIIDAAERDALDDVILLHRGKDKPALFETEFTQFAANLPGFSYLQLEKRIDKESLRSLVPDWQQRLVFLAGSDQMVQEIKTILIRGGVHENNIKHDIFTGNIS